MRGLLIEWLYLHVIIVSIITEYKIKRQLSSIYCCRWASMPVYDVNEEVFTDCTPQHELSYWTFYSRI